MMISVSKSQPTLERATGSSPGGGDYRWDVYWDGKACGRAIRRLQSSCQSEPGGLRLEVEKSRYGT